MFSTLSIATLVLSVALVSAECPNACSGHGLCKIHDQCNCEPNYFGADCSLRVCPYDYAFVDTPSGDLNHDGLVSGTTYVERQALNANKGGSPLQGAKTNIPEYEMYPTDAEKGFFAAQQDEAHFYMECSGKGECDRKAGQCVCYPGFTGASCQRSTCPSDCSGHGLCRTLREVAVGALSRRAVSGQGGNMNLVGVRTAFDYSLWDADKHQMCVCDAGFDGIDCTQRTCPRGNDPLKPKTERWCGGQICADEVQAFRLSSAGSSTYKFTFVSGRNATLVAYFTVDTAVGLPGAVADPKHFLAADDTNAGIIMDALRSIPGGELQFVEVRAKSDDLTDIDSRLFEVTFAGLNGNQYMLELTPVSGDGKIELAPYEVVMGNTEDTECSNRGLCDRVTGLCKCFGGYFGVACEYQNALTSGSN